MPSRMYGLSATSSRTPGRRGGCSSTSAGEDVNDGLGQDEAILLSPGTVLEQAPATRYSSQNRKKPEHFSPEDQRPIQNRGEEMMY